MILFASRYAFSLGMFFIVVFFHRHFFNGHFWRLSIQRKNKPHYCEFKIVLFSCYFEFSYLLLVSIKRRYCLNWVHRKWLRILFVQQLSGVFVYDLSLPLFGSWFHQSRLTNNISHSHHRSVLRF